MEDQPFKHFHNLRNKLYIIVFGTDTPAGKLFDVVLLYAILFSIISVMLESVKDIRDEYTTLFVVLEWSFTIFFTIEYLMRIFITRKPLSYVLSPLGIVDFLALMPTYLSIFISGGSYLLVVRAIRLLRVFRIFKLTRYVEEAKILGSALQGSSRKILVFMGAVSTLIIITGTLMYMIEGGENGFTSIPISIYWAVVTVTTVGYGDIAPHTILGQTFATLLMLIGYAIIAVPTGIVTSELTRKNELESAAKVKECSSCNTSNLKSANFCSNCGSSLRA